MNDKYLSVFKKHGLRFSRCFGSKSGYRDTYPDHLIIFNARIYLKSYYEKERNRKVKDFFKGQISEIYYGDIDFAIDIYKLYRIYLEIREPIVVTTESGTKIVEIGEKK